MYYWKRRTVVSKSELVDDLDARAKNLGLAALSAHPNLDVRLFNPFASRTGKFRKISEGLGSFDRINRRMHNKTWIADNRIAIAGGRNLGDEYFSANDEVNFVDLELAMVGPVVRDASASFDKYWNSKATFPIEVLDPDRVNVAALGDLRKRLAANAREAETSRYAKALENNDAIKRLISGEWPIEWSANYQFVSDDPEKVTKKESTDAHTEVAATIGPALAAMTREASIISPYFVPGDKFTDELVMYASSGKSVRILTNSLVANDVAAVHGGYSKYRKALSEGGVELWELKPSAVTSSQARPGHPARACTQRLFQLINRFCSSAATTLTPDPPGSTANKGSWSKARHSPGSSRASSPLKLQASMRGKSYWTTIMMDFRGPTAARRSIPNRMLRHGKNFRPGLRRHLIWRRNCSAGKTKSNS